MIFSLLAFNLNPALFLLLSLAQFKSELQKKKMEAGPVVPPIF